jgi:hypothetical protein
LQRQPSFESIFDRALKPKFVGGQLVSAILFVVGLVNQLQFLPDAPEIEQAVVRAGAEANLEQVISIILREIDSAILLKGTHRTEGDRTQLKPV